jgi:hypothetical protein
LANLSARYFFRFLRNNMTAAATIPIAAIAVIMRASVGKNPVGVLVGSQDGVGDDGGVGDCEGDDVGVGVGSMLGVGVGVGAPDHAPYPCRLHKARALIEYMSLFGPRLYCTVKVSAL